MKKFLFHLFAFAFHSSFCIPQFSDNFNDGDFTANPPWSGDSADFIVNSGRLHLNAPSTSDTSVVSVASKVGIEAEWHGALRLDFNPSSSNYLKFFLCSDRSDLRSPLKGYYIKFGGSKDDVSLYYQDGFDESMVIDGPDGQLNSDTVELSWSIVRNEKMIWELFIKSQSSGTFQSVGTGVDSNLLTSAYFGISCRYTSTRSDKFSFDNIGCTGKIFRDTIPPLVVNWQLNNSRQWTIVFSEPIDKASLNPLFISGDFGIDPNRLFFSDSGHHTITAEFSSDFPHGRFLVIAIHSFSDTAGNPMEAASLSSVFNYEDSIFYKDLIINEVFPDPIPQVGLPESEFIELFNRSASILDLGDWKIADNNNSSDLSGYLVGPHSFIVLIDQKDSSQWSTISNTLLVPDLPSLNNGEDCIYIISSGGRIIDSLRYDESLYGDNDKKDGGWSMELINPAYNCNNSLNWSASIAGEGGSPGKANSVINYKHGSEFIALKNFISVSESEIVLSITSPPVNRSNLANHLSIDPGLAIEGASLTEENILNIKTHGEVHTGQEYVLSLSDLTTCTGIENPEIRQSYFYPDRADSNDLVINEILFNPYPGGSDFVEIFNRSDKYLDLSEFRIANIRHDTISQTTSISKRYFLLPPKGLMAYSTDSQDVIFHYGETKMENLRNLSMPAFPDDEGNVVILNSGNNVIDQFHYSEAMHFPLIEDVEGVSLERIAADGKTSDRNNWHSASSAIGYATPGAWNSQSLQSGAGDTDFYLDPTIFSPDNDGYRDVVSINYHFKKAGNTGSISIYNSKGIRIRNLLSNELLQTNGQVVWDGTDENRSKAPVGYYIIVMETFSDDGNTWKSKASVVLANKL